MIWMLALSAYAAPKRQIPPAVLNEVRLLENRFDIALAEDCASERCYSKGCVYVDHAVTDQPRSMSLPGLGQDPGPGSVEPQEFLTQAQCSFAYEDSIDSADVRALSRRLSKKMTKGWTTVSVSTQKLEPLPEYMRSAPKPEQPAQPDPVELPEPEPPPPPATFARELWNALLPHLFWMLGILLATGAAATLIWAWRRLGQQTLEEKMLLAELERGEPASAELPVATVEVDEDALYVSEQQGVWHERLAGFDPEQPDAELQALFGELLRAHELDLLAKATLLFPSHVLPAFPAGAEFAGAKLALSDHLKEVDPASLPDDATFFRALNRHALSAALATQSDAQVVRSLREEFGSVGLTDLVQQLPARPGAILFALAPAGEQREMVRLLDPARVTDMARALLSSNRLDPAETEHLFAVLAAVRTNQPLPPAPEAVVTDRGTPFDAGGALSMLLESVHPTRRDTLFAEALDRFGGSLPQWTRSIFVSDMLLRLGGEQRADLLLELELEPVAAWLSFLDDEVRDRIQADLPSALRNSLRAVSGGSVEVRLQRATTGRRLLAEGFQRQLARSRTPFEQMLVSGAETA